jgi:hypothetical protein
MCNPSRESISNAGYWPMCAFIVGKDELIDVALVKKQPEG